MYELEPGHLARDARGRYRVHDAGQYVAERGRQKGALDVGVSDRSLTRRRLFIYRLWPERW